MRIKATEDTRVRFGGDELFFTDGSYILADHCPNCCEQNYADFSVLETMPNVLELEFDSVEITKPQDGKGGGFIMRLGGYPVFIPCYSEQNGYYSTDIDIMYCNADGEVLTTLYIECEERFY